MSLIGHDTKFICNIPDHPSVHKALDELTAFQDKSRDEKKFLEQRAKALREDRKRHWRKLWDAAVEAGLIDKNSDYDSYNMSLGDGRKQLFIEHCDCPQHGGSVRTVEISAGSVSELLRKLTGQDDDE